MNGFRDFLLRGNLVELAVAFIMGVVFAAVVEAFTKIVLDVLGLIVRVEGLSGIAVAGVNVGNFLTALITFVLTALVLYFAVVVPYNKLSDLRQDRRAGEGRVFGGPAGRDPGPAARAGLSRRHRLFTPFFRNRSQKTGLCVRISAVCDRFPKEGEY